MDPTITRKQYLEKKYREFKKQLNYLYNNILYYIIICNLQHIIITLKKKTQE